MENDVEYVFVAPEEQSILLQYSDFSRIENGKLVVVSRNLGRCCKLLNMFCKKKYGFIRKIIVLAVITSIARQMRGGDHQYCFIVHARVFDYFRGFFVDSIRNNYLGCKMVCYYEDLISRHVSDVEDVKKAFDSVYSYDEKDAYENNIIYLASPFSREFIKESDYSELNNPIKWDFTFVGHSKNRLQSIISVYECLTDRGYNCDFHIDGVRKKKQKYSKFITYNRKMLFSEVLQREVSSRCVVEIMQKNASSPTVRYISASILNRYLLTNCSLFSDEISRPNNVIYFDSIDEIKHIDFDSHFLRKPQITMKDYEKFSVDNMIKTIQSDLMNNIEKES